MVGPILAVAHLVICLVLVFLARTGRLRMSRPLLVLAFCVPIAGPLVVCIVAYENDHLIAGTDSSRLADETPKEDLDAQTNTEEPDSDVVSLEDALLDKDTGKRRDAMLNALLSDPTRYASSIAGARTNSDSEVSHFASTAMAELSRTFDEQLKTFRVAHDRYPDDTALLSSFIEFMERYLDSDLLHGNMLTQIEKEYEQLLREKHRKTPTLSDDLKLATRLIDGGELPEANTLLEEMGFSWPNAQEVWYARLRYNVADRNPEAVRQTISEMRDAEGLKIPQIKGAIEFWGREDQ